MTCERSEMERKRSIAPTGRKTAPRRGGPRTAAGNPEDLESALRGTKAPGGTCDCPSRGERGAFPIDGKATLRQA